ncbi:MAG: type II secretion system F family protein [Oscillospiraceae bacterium]|nr:type II secretion system F family protein [Oscillospiraceae bacterium]
MSRFSYSAKDADGTTKKGTMVAENDREFSTKMRDKGLMLTGHKESTSEENKNTYKFKTKELAFNCRQLSAMLTSGLTLVKALDILSKEQENEKAKKIWLDIYEQVQKGESFSKALEMQGDAFPIFMKAMVNAGESSGSLDVIMKRMEQHYDKENKLSNTIKGAMIYPIILLCLSVVVVIVIFTFIMPIFEPLFEGTDNLNPIAKFLMAFSDFLKARWYVVIIVAAALVGGIKYASTLPDVRYKMDMYKITMPKVGPLMVKIYTARFARALSSLYSSGIPMVECLERSSAILNNLYVTEKFKQVVDEVKQGETLSSAIIRTEIFESMFCSIIYVGEEAGALDDILAKSAAYYEEESDSAVQRLVGLIEPIMIIFLGCTIGLILAGIYPAIYDSLSGLENS